MGLAPDLRTGLLIARIPAAPGCEAAPCIGFIAHVDTSPDVTGDGVKPIVHRRYDGGDIRFPDDPDLVLRASEDPALAAKVGDDIVTASGLTLLGADDKAGAAIVMTLAERLARGAEPHGPVSVAFTTDEEVGHGADGARLSAMGLPAPNLFAGQHNIHSRLEWVSLQDMEKAVEVCIHLRHEPLSTFSADVDTASYANVRRILHEGRLPPQGAVRIEEMVNYFRYAYDTPRNAPVGLTTEVGECPWAPGHKLVLLGLKTAHVDLDEIPGRSFVFLLDVSGSMQPADKLPLVKAGMRMFVDTLRPADRVAIVTYAGSSGVALPSTRASNRERIHRAIDMLHASGSTNGASGIRLAYAIAREQFVEHGVNRVILATDGDFNVGVTSDSELVTLIEAERRSGVFLSVLGVGTGNLQDAKMEQLADKGNGNYSYLDSLLEARRVLVSEAASTLNTVAKDVKIQVEFNPSEVTAYRLIGYENRLLNNEDFNDDTKDAGEMGAGHAVTALYEIVPKGVDPPAAAGGRPPVDPLVYQTDRIETPRAGRGELLTFSIRYKEPDSDISQVIRTTARAAGAPASHLPFASAVAEFTMLLRGDLDGDASRWHRVAGRARAAKGADDGGYRAELAKLIELAAGLEPITTSQRRH